MDSPNKGPLMQSFDDSYSKTQLEQLNRLRSKDTPDASWLPTLLFHIGSQVKKNKVKVTNLKNLPKF